MQTNETSCMQSNFTQEKMRTERQAETHIRYIYSITVRKVSEKHPNEISQRIIIFPAMLTQERFRHTEHLLTDISSDILLLLSLTYSNR